MQHLHAYWRTEYVEAPKKDKNPQIFKSIAANPDADEENFVLHRSQHSFIIMNRYPYNAGHLLVLPLRETPTLESLSQEEKLDLLESISKAQSTLQEALSPSGFNVGFNIGSAAGAGIPAHLHCHVVPRWESDTNFMPVIGDIRVLHQSMESMFRRLKQFV